MRCCLEGTIVPYRRNGAEEDGWKYRSQPYSTLDGTACDMMRAMWYTGFSNCEVIFIIEESPTEQCDYQPANTSGEIRRVGCEGLTE